ncbi:hypothetical protein GCM10023339_25450 [Alloalcanivorax gelatiniphagus]
MRSQIRRRGGADRAQPIGRHSGTVGPRGAAAVTLLALLALVAGTGGPLSLTPPAAAKDQFALELDQGHVDAFTLLWSDSELRVGLQEDVTGHHVLHDPEDVLLRVKEAARTTLPTPVPDSLSFLGEGGSDVWFLPQTQDPDLIWPGWSTERVPAGVFTDPMRIHVEAVDGPGKVFVWQTGSFGESTSMLDSGGHQLPGRIATDVNAHVHANWAFSEPGRYVLTVRASGTRTTGGTVESAPVTYTFDVGDGTTTPPPTTPPTTPPPTTPPPATPPPTTPPPTTPPPTTPSGTWDVPNGTVNSRGATVLNNGHVDVASVLEGKKLVTRVKDTTTSTAAWRDPATTVLQLLPRTRTTVPPNPAYAFLGAPGGSFYQVTQTQQPGLLWPGWSTEGIPADATTGGVLWTLDDMSGPGQFAIYETDPFGRPSVLFNTRDGITEADRFTIPKNTHAHGSWAFSEQGLYCLSGQRVAQLTSGETVSDHYLLAVAVGAADVMDVDPALCGKEVVTDAPVVAPPSADDDRTGGKGRDKGKNKGKDEDNGGDQGSDEDTGGQDQDSGARGDVPTGPGAADCLAPVARTVPPAPSARTRAVTVLSAGHIDYAARIVGGRLTSQIGDDTSGSKVYREPSSTVLWLRPQSRVTLPSGYGEVGPPGSTVWQVPQTQDPALIWLGWNTEQLNAGNARGGVTWRLDGVQGPGTVKVYLSGSFGGVQDMVFTGAGSSYTIPLGVHTHANWAFSEEGVYRLTSTQSVTLADGTRSSDTETMTIAVGDVDPTSVPTTATPDASPDAGATDADTGTGTDCDSAAGGGDVTSGDAQVAAAAAPQVAAPAAPAGVSLDVPSAAADTEVAAAAAVADPRESEPVPLLLGALGGLLLFGAGGTGALWWRRPSLAAGGAT